MNPKFPLFVVLILSCFSVFSTAQKWSGVLDPSRAVDWSSVGIPGGIPDRSSQCGSTIAAYSGTAATINNAIATCASGDFVSLAAGTFTLSGDIVMASNVTLRGAGPDQTIIKFTAGGSACSLPGTDDVCFAGTFNWSGGPQHLTTWTGGYAPGTTEITLGSVSGLSVGQLLILDQANDASDTGSYFVNDTTTYSTEGGSPGRSVSGEHYSQQEYKLVTAISGNTVTILPGLYSPNWASANHPSAWWANAVIRNAGIEDLTLDHSASNNLSGTTFFNAYQCWMKNIRSIYQTNSNGGGRNHVWFQYSAHIVVRDSYFYGTRDAANLSYGVEPWQSGDLLVENNIFQHIVSPLVIGGTEGSVFGYNYSFDQYYAASKNWNMPGPSFTHDAGTSLNLFEGNQGTGMVEDNIHGTHNLHTYFRNLWIVQDDTSKTMQTIAVELSSYARFMNIIGNVMGKAGYSNNYQAVAPTSTNCNTSIYAIGFQSSGCQNSLDATLVKSTLLRWGNYDTVTNAVRWCGNSSSPGWSTTCSSTSEVPTGLSKFDNAVPASTALPKSFYLDAQPAFWTTSFGTPPWPAIGPDVSGGNVISGSGTGSTLGGHAYNIPSSLCYANGPIDARYPGGSGRGVLLFNANNCYGNSSGTPPPQALHAIVQ